MEHKLIYAQLIDFENVEQILYQLQKIAIFFLHMNPELYQKILVVVYFHLY